MVEANRRTFLSWLSRSGLALAAVGTAGAWPASASAERSDVLVFTNATLIDGTGAPPRPGTTIVVAGNRIAAVGHHNIAPPAGVRVVDLRGRYVLPGLWEMHSHTLGLENLLAPSYIVNGVTTVREMWGVPHVRSVRERIMRGELLGPRMVVASNLIDAPDSPLTGFAGNNPALVATPDEARAAVRQAKRDKADFVKVWSYLRHDTFVAAADEARRLRIPIAGHVPDRLSPVLGSEVGLRTQEHLYSMYVETSRERDKIRDDINVMQVDPKLPFNWFFAVRELEKKASLSYDPGRAAEVFATLARNGTALCPTLGIVQIFNFPREFFLGDPRVKFLPPWVVPIWHSNLRLAKDFLPGEIEAGRAFYDASLRMLDDAIKAGVRVIPGNDVSWLAAYQFAGSSLHDELARLVDSGLTPMQAIQAGTLNSARTVDLEHVSGSVTPGKFADLLVLDANPLADIRNTQRIHAVVTNGRLIGNEERQRILAKIEEDAKTTPEPAVQVVSCCAVPRP